MTNPRQTTVTCDLCGGAALGQFYLDRGCVARPDLKQQNLCLHHAMRSQPSGSMRLVEDFTIDGSFGRVWSGETHL